MSTIVTHAITWITGVETVKRQTRATYGCVAAGQSPCCGLGCAPALSVTYTFTAAAVFGMWRNPKTFFFCLAFNYEL